MTKENIIKIWQWLLIGFLAIACFYFWHKSKEAHKNFIENTSYQKNDNQYVNIVEDKSLSELKKENKELYDSIKKLSDVKEAVQVKYVTKYNTDTVFVDNTIMTKDSVYHYSEKTDTISYDLDVKGKDVEWFKLGFTLQDSLMIVRRGYNGQNETIITHGNNTTISETTVFVPKKTFMQKVKDNTYWGVGVGAGYGVFSKKADIYIGINAGIRF